MKVLHIIPYIGREKGGPVFSLADYTRTLCTLGCSVTIAAMPRPDDGPPAAFDPAVNFVKANRAWLGMFRYSPGFARQFWLDGDYAVIHSHGLWTYASIAADQIAAGLRKPHLITPCGMLQDKALARSALKKNVCRKLFQDRILNRATCLHAKSASEQAQVRSFGFRKPVAVIPNPVMLQEPAPTAADVQAWKLQHGIDKRRVALFIGRLHPVKGLAKLIDAWSEIQPDAPGWHLVLAGPDEDGYQVQLQNRVRQAGCLQYIKFIGPVDASEKARALAAADLFVMPSEFENFGTAAAEAMAAGLPVLTTTGTPWNELPAAHAGWFVEPQSAALAAALREAVGMSAAAREAMGKNAANLAANFTSPTVGRQLIELYGWLAGETAMPAFVTRNQE